MDDLQNSQKVKAVVKFIGGLFVLMGGVNFVDFVVHWSSPAMLSLLCLLPVYFLMLIGGALLLSFRPDRLELIFLTLRFYVVLGVGTIVSGILVKQSSTTIVGCIVLFLAAGLIIFLSQNNVKASFAKKE